VRDTNLGNQPTLSSLLVAAERGDESAASALFSALYSELHRLGADPNGDAFNPSAMTIFGAWQGLSGNYVQLARAAIAAGEVISIPIR
jgi:hypothetical protein